MDLKELGIKENRIKLFQKKGFFTVEDIQNFFPRDYHDFTNPVSLLPVHSERFVSVTGILKSVKAQKTNETLMVKAKVWDETAKKDLHVMWIGAYYIRKIIENWEDEEVVVCGKLTYHSEYRSFHMLNPIVFDRDIQKHLKIYPVYRKMSGISEEYMNNLIAQSLKLPIEETLPEDIIKKYRLMPLENAVKAMHNPASMEELKRAKQRLVYDKMLYFATHIEMEERSVSKGTIFNIKTLKNTNAYIDSLPFELTDSQKRVFGEMEENAYNGIRVNAIVQGDVGSGKTMIAFLMMFAMADSGYQSVLMAPTIILAKQHYISLKEAGEKYGYRTAFLSSELKKKDRSRLLKEIADGQYQFVVGTHSVISDQVVYRNLALVVIDEEHKFGVQQRDMISEKAKYGVHRITMSATPIPRTLAGAVYGTSISVYDLELPSIRKPVQTAIFNNDIKICEFICKKILDGQQAYVVCPYIDDPEEKTGIQTVEKTLEQYKKYFDKQGITIACVTGKMKAEESDNIIKAFSEGALKILIATTIIEVGVNVPSANIIVINNAERFGLSQLHQLRGRVGRGKDQGYCILKSSEKDNPRLQVICRTTNGYKIAQEDMRLRGTGDLLGTEQSGQNEYINLILQYPNMYEFVKKDAKALVDRGWKWRKLC